MHNAEKKSISVEDPKDVGLIHCFSSFKQPKTIFWDLLLMEETTPKSFLTPRYELRYIGSNGHFTFASFFFPEYFSKFASLLEAIPDNLHFCLHFHTFHLVVMVKVDFSCCYYLYYALAPNLVDH